MPRAMCGVFALLVMISPAKAQVATDGSLGAQTSLSGPNYLIDAALGQQRGTNLFHSFATFSIGSAESATFETASGTANIIARVTGGFGSQIDGALNANANLFLLNPQGILVGANASINVTGSLHLSTADYLRLGNGARFYANVGGTSVLSTAAPSAFGFLDGAIAPIQAAGTDFSLANEQSLSLIGGDVLLEGVDVSIPGGRVNVVAAAGPGEVVLTPANADASSLVARGDVRFDNVSINGVGVEAADVYIRGGRFVMENGSSIAGNATQLTSVRAIDVEAEAIQIRDSVIDYRSEAVAVGASAIFRATDLTISESSTISLSGGGNVSMTVGRLQVDSGSSVGTQAGSGGRSGNLAIAADAVIVNAATLTTSSGESDAGGIGIAADSVNIAAGGRVVSTTGGAGGGGSISIDARELSIDGTQSTRETGIFAGSASAMATAGAAGEVIVDVATLRMSGGFISSSTSGPGRGGNIRVSAENVSMERNASVTTETGIAAGQGVPQSYGDGGAIIIHAAHIDMSSGARVSAGTLADGAGGSITIDAGSLSIDSAGAALTTGITANSGSASASASGNGGNLTLNVNELRIENQGQIASNAYGAGQAGRIEVSSNTLSITSGGVISASSFGQATNAGAANDIVVVAQQLDLDDFGQITNSTTGAGNAGQLSITADRIRIANGGLLQASSLSQSAQAGAVGDISIDSRTLTMSGGGINARSFGGASPGTIAIEANAMTLDDGAVVSATSAGNGDAGFIAIRIADTLRLGNSSRITTEALQGSGGNVQVIAGNRLLLSDSAISTSVLGPAANGGNIFIDPIYVIMSNSQIIARAVGGSGGAIDLTTQILIRDANSSIDASSALGISGRVDIAGIDINLDADFTALPVDFLDTPQWQTTPCANRGSASRFTLAGRDGAYRSPLDYLQSPLSLGDPSRQARTLDESRPDTSLATAISLPSFATLCLSGG
jgi:filamentous hemagglutinin family protein